MPGNPWFAIDAGTPLRLRARELREVWESFIDAGEAAAVQSNPAGSPRPRLKVCLLGRDRAEIELDGRAVTLSRRHSELLALLVSRPHGMTSEELALDLYGHAGQPVAARVEVHRLRKVLGGAIETDPYRLAMDVESDLVRIRSLLGRGAVYEAALRYEGPLLPHSEAPGIARARVELEAWLRNAVLTADNEEALWAWVQCPSGRDDLPAWKRLLARLGYRDPRRSLAAVQIGSLRSVYGNFSHAPAVGANGEVAHSDSPPAPKP